ncbi:MAG TPA: hypothetical protein VLF61_04645, partial [Rhabdochlamydiaceae bacterium]|nr:hypothetical protein [Rhabdochlamydiaceae bacterium]
MASTDLDFPKLKQAEESFATCSSSIASVSGTLPTRVSSVVAELQSSTFSLKNASVDRETRRLSRRIPLPPSLLTVETPRLDIEQRYQAALLEIQTIPNELNIPLENLAALIDSASQTSSVQELNKKLDEPMAPRSTAMEKARPVLQNIIAKIKNAIKEFEDQGSIDFLIEKLAEKHGVNEIKMRRFIIVAKGRLKQIAEKHQVDRHMLLQRAINPKAHSARLIQVIEIPVVSSAMQSLVTSSFSSPSTSMRLAPSIEADNKETPLPRM